MREHSEERYNFCPSEEPSEQKADKAYDELGRVYEEAMGSNKQINKGVGSTLLTWFRWIALLPSAAIGSLLFSIAITGLSMATLPDYILEDRSWRNGFTLLFLGFSRSMMLGASFVFIAWYVAPSSKIIVAYIACGLIIFYAGALLCSNLLYPEPFSGFDLALWGLNTVSLISSSVIAAVHIQKDLKTL